MEPIKVDFTGNGGNGKGNGKNAYLVPSKAGLRMLISIIGTIIGGAIAYYFMLPPLNFKSTDTYMFIGTVIAIFIALLFVTSSAYAKPEYTPYVRKKSIIPLALAAVLVVVVGIGFVVSSVFFRAKTLSMLMKARALQAISLRRISQMFPFLTTIRQRHLQTVPSVTLRQSARFRSLKFQPPSHRLTIRTIPSSLQLLLTATFSNGSKTQKAVFPAMLL